VWTISVKVYVKDPPQREMIGKHLRLLLKGITYMVKCDEAKRET
jgi:hypothetical protein